MSTKPRQPISTDQQDPLIRFFLDRNKEQSDLFSSPDNTLARRLYRQQHPTEFMVLKCMDGRINWPIITETPIGIVQPVRNIGGQFDLGWPYLGEVIGDWVAYCVAHGRRCIILATYHWSKGDTHRGCRGFNYDVDLAKKKILELKKQIERVFGDRHEVVYPILVGIETDEDALLLHGNDENKVFNLADSSLTDEAFIRHQIVDLFPDMHPQLQADLLPHMTGNISHIAKLRANPRPVKDIVHGEQGMAIGRGFDWLHLMNKVLIVGPYSFDLAEPIATAAGILLSNLREGRIPKEQGVVLMTSGAFRDDVGFSPQIAREKARSLAHFALDIITERVPELTEHLHVLAGVANMNTRVFTPIEL